MLQRQGQSVPSVFSQLFSAPNISREFCSLRRDKEQVPHVVLSFFHLAHGICRHRRNVSEPYSVVDNVTVTLPSVFAALGRALGTFWLFRRKEERVIPEWLESKLEVRLHDGRLLTVIMIMKYLKSF